MPRSRLVHRVDRYASDVDTGRIVAGPLVRLAAARHLRDRHAAATKTGHPSGLFFHEAAANHIIEFFEGVLRLPDTLDEYGDPVPFALTPANTFIVGSIFGWKMPTGLRRFREAYVEEGKGNAKTPLAAGIGLYGLTMDGEQAAEIYSVASGIDQARICWLDADRMVEASPELCDLIHRSSDNLAYAATYSWFRPLSKEKRGKSGPRPHMVFFDEEHEYADAVVVNKMRAGMKRRKQPLSLGITNSGYDRTSICWQHHEHGRKVLEGLVDDQRLFAYICGLDEGDDPLHDKACHIKANPNLGIIIHQDYLDRQVENANNIPSEQNDVLRLNFCVWTSVHSPAWDMRKWRECGKARTFAEQDLLGHPCYGGLDLGQTDDFAAWARLWDLDTHCVVKMRFWLPRAALKKYPDRPYAEWERAGLLQVTDGDTTDVDLIEEAVLEDARTDGVLEIGFDKRFANQLALHLQGAGITMVDQPQGYALNESIRSVAKLIADAALVYDPTDLILPWMMDNTVLRAGPNKQVRVDKEAAREKIDGAVALVIHRNPLRRTRSSSFYEPHASAPGGTPVRRRRRHLGLCWRDAAGPAI
jgi:phage terminase large subunit-like protein